MNADSDPNLTFEWQLPDVRLGCTPPDSPFQGSGGATMLSADASSSNTPPAFATLFALDSASSPVATQDPWADRLCDIPNCDKSDGRTGRRDCEENTAVPLPRTRPDSWTPRRR